MGGGNSGWTRDRKDEYEDNGGVRTKHSRMDYISAVLLLLLVGTILVILSALIRIV